MNEWWYHCNMLPTATTENTTKELAEYLSDEIMMHPEKREFPPFDVVRLLSTVFEPTEGCRVVVRCMLTIVRMALT